ncbi:HSF-type DNA-binding [Thraustotheca clavata]|uniref:HSF-type DNA-binding n=1 Tax=Thraustotheca clavata TaxID=74557 RepID=A0A1V9ZQ60_9STRA|nr:HSF-type DNA-binding [Thraustotheca clavata]
MQGTNKVKTGNAPIFLQKTYTMFENSPDSVAAWANNGTTIVIKDPEEFARSVLPKYFKHNNFASYVRQLNFYGFRKYKKDDIVIVDDDKTKHWWEFYHEQFLRAKPELMAQIRRKTYSESDSTEKEDVEVLKSQVVSFQNQLEQLTGQITNLTAVVSALMARSAKRPIFSQLICTDRDDLVLLRFRMKQFPCTIKMSVAVFLQKTMELLGSCPVEIASWTMDGNAFVIKNPKAFEQTMLPRYFKHSNFASFARQLRFYGFDKTKKLQGSGGLSMWEFKHPKFRRDEPDKMASIRRKTCTEPNGKWEKEDVDMLKSKMGTLQSQLSTLTEQIDLLTYMVHEYAEQIVHEDNGIEKFQPSTDMFDAVMNADEFYADIDYDILDNLGDKPLYELST